MRPAVRILFIHSSAELYGSDRCLGWLVRGLVSRGFQPEAVLPAHGPLEAELSAIGVRVHIIDPVVFRRSVMNPLGAVKLVVGALPSVIRLSRLMRRGNFDLVHTNTGVVIGGAIAARLARIPHVWHFREVLSEFGLMWRSHQLLVGRTSAAVICISDRVASQFVSAGLRNRLTIVHDGIPVPPESALAVTEREADGTCRLISVGRIAPYKGQDVLIRAVGSLVEEGFDVRLDIVGGVYGGQVEYLDNLKRLVAELGITSRVDFLGFRDDVASCLDKADIFVLPSRRPEGLGLVVLEALARAKAVVATDNGGAAEIIDDGVNGILVGPEDPGAIAAAVSDIVSGKVDGVALGRRGYETVVERFSEARMVDDVISIYEKVMSKE